MKGDFSRSTFHREKHYSKVNYQQGRVLVDADHNEQIDIIHHYERTALKDVIGQSGFPKGLPSGFEIKSQNTSQNPYIYHIGKGRFYVDGILVENESNVAADKQPDLPSFKNGTNLAVPDPEATDNKHGIYFLIYLDVWERHITYLDDPPIKESALGGPDTATRNKIVWQVKSKLIDTPTCELPPEFWSTPDSPGGKLKARTKPGLVSDDPCKIIPGSGYRGLENQLYRIEIHNSGKPGENSSSFKWSRDNGTVCTKVLNITNKTITVTDIGKDKLLGFNNQQWVEVSDDRHILLGLPGTIAQVNVINENELAIVAGSVKGEALTNSNYPQLFNPQVRRWDSPGGIVPITVPSSNAGFVPIENGIEIRFQQSKEYKTGDYYCIPARTLAGDIEWPRVNDVPQYKPPDGIKHHYASLAIVMLHGNKIGTIRDCRKEFPPLTDLGPSVPSPPTSSTPANVSTWAHGNVAWANNPSVVTSQKQFDGTKFKFKGTAILHFPLSYSFSTEANSKLALTNVHLLFTINTGRIGISAIGIIDGKGNNPVAYTIPKPDNNIQPITPSDNTGSNLIPNKNSWTIPSVQISFGLGITVSIFSIDSPIASGQSESEITFHSIGADFVRV
jgi:hypothetical protein